MYGGRAFSGISVMVFIVCVLFKALNAVCGMCDLCLDACVFWEIQIQKNSIYCFQICSSVDILV